MHSTSYSNTMRRIARSIGILFFGFCIVTIILNLALPAGSRAAGEPAATAAAEASIAPAADTFVKSNEPNTNFGSAGRLVVDAKPASTSLIRFEVAGIGQTAVRQARLRLFVTAADAPAGLKLFSADSGWDEMAVTWNKQPARGAQVRDV